MAGLVPAIHVLLRHKKEDVDARHKAGHDGDYPAARSAFSRWMISVASLRYASLPTHLRS